MGVVRGPVAAVAIGAGLPRVNPTDVSPARTSSLCSLSSPGSALQCAHSAHPPGPDSGHPLSVATTPDAPVLRSAVLTPVCSTTPASCPLHTMDKVYRSEGIPNIRSCNLLTTYKQQDPSTVN